MGPELQIESCSRDTLDWRLEAWVLDLALLKTQHLTLGESFPLLNISFLICKVSSVFFFHVESFFSAIGRSLLSVWNWQKQSYSYGSSCWGNSRSAPTPFIPKEPQKHLSFTLGLWRAQFENHRTKWSQKVSTPRASASMKFTKQSDFFKW